MQTPEHRQHKQTHGSLPAAPLSIRHLLTLQRTQAHCQIPSHLIRSLVGHLVKRRGISPPQLAAQGWCRIVERRKQPLWLACRKSRREEGSSKEHWSPSEASYKPQRSVNLPKMRERSHPKEKHTRTSDWFVESFGELEEPLRTPLADTQRARDSSRCRGLVKRFLLLTSFSPSSWLYLTLLTTLTQSARSSMPPQRRRWRGIPRRWTTLKSPKSTSKRRECPRRRSER